MNKALISSLALSLFLTVALEIGFFMITYKYDKKDFLLVVLVNVVTNPVVVLLYWLAALYTAWNLVMVLIPLELFAILTEGYYFKKYGRRFRRPYLFSTAVNIFSFGIGLLVQIFI